MGSFKRVEGKGANSKILVGFRCKVEGFIASSDSMNRTDCSLLKVFLTKYVGRKAEFLLSVVGLSASLIASTVTPLLFCVPGCFVPEMSFLETSCFGLPLSCDINLLHLMKKCMPV